MRVVPENNHAPFHSNADKGAPSAEIVHDTFRHGLPNTLGELNNRSDLERRLDQWEESQLNLKLQGICNMFGEHEVKRREMELELVQNGDIKPSVLGGPSNLHRDILLGNDTEIDMKFFMPKNECMDMHTEAEKRYFG